MADKPAIILRFEEVYFTDKDFEFETTEESDASCFASGDDNVDKLQKADKEENIKENETEQKVETVVVTEEPTVISAPPEPKVPSLEELANSDYIRNRQLAAKSIIENLHEAGSDKEALHSVISIMCKLSEDEELLVRSELIEHIPSIALFCEEHSDDLGVVIRQQIVPYTVKSLTDIQYQIRKSSHTTLLSLLENRIIDQSQLSEWICPLIAEIAASGNTPEELRCEDVSVMCKLTPYVGKEIAQKFFLEPFISLCCDTSEYVRKICAQNFGEMSLIFGADVTESVLLPAFLNLCSDEHWSVRKECADVFSVVASLVSPKARHEVLPHIFINLLNDESRSVWSAAYQSLGEFIATFADPWKTGLQYSDGVWYAQSENEQNSTQDLPNVPNENEFERVMSEMILNPHFLDDYSFKRLNSSLSTDNCTLTCGRLESRDFKEDSFCSKDNFFGSADLQTQSNRSRSDENFNQSSEMTDMENTLNNKGFRFDERCEKDLAGDSCSYFRVNNENLFNNFQFWRTPIPDLELDIEESKSENRNATTKLHSEDFKTHTSEFNISILSEKSSRENICQRSNISTVSLLSNKDDHLSRMAWLKHRRISKFNKTSKIEATGSQGRSKKPEMTVFDQDIVPPELLEKYLSSAKQFPVNEEDKNVSCAYNFPSVAYTLGRKYWPCLRNLFNLLAIDLKYTVRKIMAASLHELAVILGNDIAREDLVPVFLEFINDAEAVRTKVLLHVSQFLKHLSIQDRRRFLPLIEEICTWQDTSNWRYRFTVAEQLIPCVELFTSSEALYFFPVPLSLMQDKVFAVRKAAVQLLAVIIKSMAGNLKSSDFIKAVLVALDDKYRKSNKWLWRQLYVFICEELALKRSLPTEFYVDEIVPNLFSLAWDTVANVRLAVARCIGLTLLPLDFLPSIQRKHYQLLLQVMLYLQSDTDKDVRHFANLSAAAFNVMPPKKLSPV